MRNTTRFLSESPRKYIAAFLVAAILLLPSMLSLVPVKEAQATVGFTDFNGDGFEDLAIGVWGEGVGSVAATAGAVNVIYGSSQGLKATAVAAGNGRADQIWSQASTDIADFPEFSDRFGWSLTIGDFNNDGFSDLAVGVPGEGVGSVAGAGAVNVIYGSSQGLKATAVAAGNGRADQFWTQNSANVDDSAEQDDSFGSSLAAGDFNNDGFADLAIGVSGEDLTTFKGITFTDAGAVNVLYGSATGLQVTSPADQFWHQNSPDVEDAVEANDFFGNTLASGDFNNDGFTDLVVGVIYEDVGAIFDAGAVNVLYGSASGLQATSPADQFLNQDSIGVDDIAEEGDNFGNSLATGDFNNDGFSDLAIGAFWEDDGSTSDVGLVQVIYGSASGLQIISPHDQVWHQDFPLDIEGTSEAADQFGASLAVGDFNNDGRSDLAIGVVGDRAGSVSNAGSVNVIYGSPTGLTNAGDQLWNQASSGIKGTTESGDDFGRSLASGDFNNDGRSDLAIGVPNETLEDANDEPFVPGAVNVIYGSAAGLSDIGNQMWQQNTTNVEDSIEDNDQFGFALASG